MSSAQDLGHLRRASSPAQRPGQEQPGADQNGHNDTPTSTDLRDNEAEAVFAAFAQDQEVDRVSLFAAENRLLTLWDELQQLQLEVQLLETRDQTLSATTKNTVKTLSNDKVELQVDAEGSQNGPGELLQREEELAEAEKACLRASGEHFLRQQVTENTLITAPVLEAIHGGNRSKRDTALPKKSRSDPRASMIERTLLPLIRRRDALEVAASNLNNSLQRIRRETYAISQQRVSLLEEDRAKMPQTQPITRHSTLSSSWGENQRANFRQAQAEARIARQRYRMMKAVLAGIVVESGLDWSNDAVLLALVLEDEVDAKDELLTPDD